MAAGACLLSLGTLFCLLCVREAGVTPGTVAVAGGGGNPHSVRCWCCRVAPGTSSQGLCPLLPTQAFPGVAAWSLPVSGAEQCLGRRAGPSAAPGMGSCVWLMGRPPWPASAALAFSPAARLGLSPHVPCCPPAPSPTKCLWQVGCSWPGQGVLFHGHASPEASLASLRRQGCVVPSGDRSSDRCCAVIPALLPLPLPLPHLN